MSLLYVIVQFTTPPLKECSRQMSLSERFPREFLNLTLISCCCDVCGVRC